jgi:hypothetical protein
MKKKGIFAGISSLMLVFTLVTANAETIAAYFQCVDDDAVSGAYISLGSDGSCILIDPSDGTRLRGTYEIDKVPRRGETGNITFYVGGNSETVVIGWPMNGNLGIYMGDWRFEKIN